MDSEPTDQAEPAYQFEQLDRDNWYQLHVSAETADYDTLRKRLDRMEGFSPDNDSWYHDSGTALWLDEGADEVTVRFYKDEEPAEAELDTVASYLRGELPDNLFNLGPWLLDIGEGQVTYEEAQELADTVDTVLDDPEDHGQEHPGQPRL